LVWWGQLCGVGACCLQLQGVGGLCALPVCVNHADLNSCAWQHNITLCGRVLAKKVLLAFHCCSSWEVLVPVSLVGHVWWFMWQVGADRVVRQCALQVVMLQEPTRCGATWLGGVCQHCLRQEVVAGLADLGHPARCMPL
jgi:hypothetical protein